MKTLSPKLLWFLLLTPSLFGFDLWTKAEATGIPDGEEVAVFGRWLAFVHAENPNIAFSTPVPLPLIFLAGLVGIGLVLHALWQQPASARAVPAALGLLAAGALGNLVDRVPDGSVTDFIMVSARDTSWAPWLREQLGTATWPIFNVADVCLLAGVLLYLVASLLWEPAEDEPVTA